MKAPGDAIVVPQNTHIRDRPLPPQLLDQLLSVIMQMLLAQQ